MFRKIFKKKNKTNTEYQVGDIVYLLAYPFRRYAYGDKVKCEGLGEQLRIFKMKITKIEFDISNKPKYFTDVKTDLEQNFGGYYDFDSWEKIKQAIDRFVDDNYKLEKEK